MGRNADGGSRREFLALSAAAAAGLAGCGELGGSDGSASNGSGANGSASVPASKFPSLSIPESKAESLERIDGIRRTIDARGVAAYAAGGVYELADVTERVSEKTMGELSRPLALFFGAKLNLEGLATRLASPRLIAIRSKGLVRDRLEAQGVANVREVAASEPLPDLEGSHTVEYRGEFETPSFAREARLGDGSALPIEVPSQRLPIAGTLTAWKTSAGTAYVAGGGYPAEDYEATARSSVTSEVRDGIDVEVIVDLNLDPPSLRKRLNGLVTSLS